MGLGGVAARGPRKGKCPLGDNRGSKVRESPGTGERPAGCCAGGKACFPDSATAGGRDRTEGPYLRDPHSRRKKAGGLNLILGHILVKIRRYADLKLISPLILAKILQDEDLSWILGRIVVKIPEHARDEGSDAGVRGVKA